MASFIALLRAVNVGGSGKLPMSDIKALCEATGFTAVRTFIASGNVVFESDAPEAEVKANLEKTLRAYADKAVGVLVRTSSELAQILAHNPFPQAAPNKTVVIFLDRPTPADALDNLPGRRNEEVRPGHRELYVYYPEGMGRSKFRVPAATQGTARNMNTVAKLVEMTTRT